MRPAPAPEVPAPETPVYDASRPEASAVDVSTVGRTMDVADSASPPERVPRSLDPALRSGALPAAAPVVTVSRASDEALEEGTT